MDPMVSVRQIRKKYGRQTALENVSFEVGRGEIFGLIGPDGAGKTTLFRILTTLILPDAGQARVCGYDVVSDFRRIRERVGYMPGRFSLYPDLSVEENLKFFASVFGTTVQENYGLVADIYRQLEPFRRRAAAKLSGGMKQKLALCCALIHRPEVLFLDEPTTGVDPVSRKEFWDMLSRLREGGITIVVSTPYMDEAGRCGRIGLIREGGLMGIDTPQAILAGFGAPLWQVSVQERFVLADVLRAWPGTETAYPFGEFFHLIPRAGHTQEELENYLKGKNLTRVSVGTAQVTVEDCYMRLSGKKREEGYAG